MGRTFNIHDHQVSWNADGVPCDTMYHRMLYFLLALNTCHFTSFHCHDSCFYCCAWLTSIRSASSRPIVWPHFNAFVNLPGNTVIIIIIIIITVYYARYMVLVIRITKQSLNYA